jgi:hypothetical protein
VQAFEFSSNTHEFPESYSLRPALGLFARPAAGRDHGRSGERLPIKTYTIADGLARDNVMRIRRDSKGFLWFCSGSAPDMGFTNSRLNRR